MIDFTKRQVLFFTYFILLALCFFAFFAHLDHFPLMQWDESRQAVSALEMIQNHKYFINYYDGTPDMWSTKTPFYVWFVAASMKLLGYNLLALRLPSALFGLATAFFLFSVCRSYLKEIRIGILSVLVLITSIGFLYAHVSRTGDCDVLLALLTMIYTIYFFKYANESDARKQNRFLWIFTIAIALAVLTKNIVGLLMLPGIIIYIFMTKKSQLFADIRLYRSMLFFIVIAGSMYAIREIQNEGYLNAVWQNDIAGRYFQANEGHRGEFWYYFNNFMSNRFNPWIYLVPVAIFISFFNSSPLIRNMCLYLSVLSVSFFLIMSLSETKITWYDAPLYPMLALLTGMGIYTMYEGFITVLNSRTNYNEKIFFPVLLIVIFFIPYSNMAVEVTGHHWEDNSPGGYLMKVEDKFPNFKRAIMVADNPQVIQFYKEILENKGKKIVITDFRPYELSNGDTLCSCYDRVNSVIESKYNYDIIYHELDCKTYRINRLND